jgi:3-ketosteroid 9alpha-monooxygenase subunit B
MIIDPYTWHRLPIRHIAHSADETLSIRTARPVGYMYRAGQYVVMRVNVDGMPILRQYSLVSSPENDFLEFLIQREPGGSVSGWFHSEARVGTMIELSQPLGSFTIDSPQSPLLLVAGRVGIAPFIGLIRDELAHQRGDNISLIYSARGESQFCYPDLLRSVRTTFVDTALDGRLTPATLQTHIEPTTRVYLCGSKQFVDSLYEALRELGVASTRIKKELFTLQ